MAVNTISPPHATRLARVDSYVDNSHQIPIHGHIRTCCHPHRSSPGQVPIKRRSLSDGIGVYLLNLATKSESAPGGEVLKFGGHACVVGVGIWPSSTRWNGMFTVIRLVPVEALARKSKSWILAKPGGFSSQIALVDTQCLAGIPTPSNGDWSVGSGSRWLPFSLSLAETDVDRSDQGEMIEFRFPDDVKPLLDSGCLYFMSVDSIISPVKQHLSGIIQAGLMGMSKITDTAGFSTMNINDISSFDGPDFIQRIYNRGFPAFLAVCTALFFLMVVEATKRRGSSVWKVSPLAWILRADGLDNVQYSSSTRLCEGMKERLRSIAARTLDEDRDGPRNSHGRYQRPELALDT